MYVSTLEKRDITDVRFTDSLTCVCFLVRSQDRWSTRLVCRRLVADLWNHWEPSSSYIPLMSAGAVSRELREIKKEGYTSFPRCRTKNGVGYWYNDGDVGSSFEIRLYNHICARKPIHVHKHAHTWTSFQETMDSIFRCLTSITFDFWLIHLWRILPLKEE